MIGFAKRVVLIGVGFEALLLWVGVEVCIQKIFLHQSWRSRLGTRSQPRLETFALESDAREVFVGSVSAAFESIGMAPWASWHYYWEAKRAR